jgi:hypothetical protein
MLIRFDLVPEPSLNMTILFSVTIAGEYVPIQRNNSKSKSHVSHGGIKIVRKLLEIETKQETEKAEKEGVLYTTKKKKICVRKLYVRPSKNTGNGCSSLNNNSRLSVT